MRTPSPTAFVATFLSSYLCASGDPSQTLCFGVSLDNLINETLSVQLKARGAVGANDEFFKLRWNINDTSSTICSAANPSSCVMGHPSTLAINTESSLNSWSAWNLTAFFDERGFSGPLRHLATGRCATIITCHVPSGETFCRYPGTGSAPILPATVLEKGSYVLLNPCSPEHALAQTWTQQLDCAPGCSPFMQDAPGPCYSACKNDACDFQDDACATPSPSKSPSMSPTVPTSSPTPGPSRSPSESPSSTPTSSPSLSPSFSSPSMSPSPSPSTSPSIAPSSTPSRSPITMSPTSSPSTMSPTSRSSGIPWEDDILAPVLIGVFLILLACLLRWWCR